MDAYDEGIRMFNHWINIWEQSGDAGASFIISSLMHDRDVLIALPGMELPVQSEKGIFPQIATIGYGMIMSVSLL